MNNLVSFTFLSKIIQFNEKNLVLKEDRNLKREGKSRKFRRLKFQKLTKKMEQNFFCPSFLFKS